MAIDIFGAVKNNPLMGLLTGVAQIVAVLVLIIIMAVVVWLFLKRKKHNIPVIIFSERAGQRPKIVTDKGGYFTKKGQYYFSLLKLRRKIPPPDTKYLYTGAKGLNILFLHQKGLKDYVPVYFDVMEGDLKYRVADTDTQLWADGMQKDIARMLTKENWMQKYGSFVIFGITAMMCFLLVYIVLQKLDTIPPALASMAKSFEHAAEGMSKCIQQGVPA
jgi:hypothetical protein